MSQEDRPEAQTAASTAVEEYTSPARQWATSKRVAPVLMKVLLTNKSDSEDIKVWYRLHTKNAGGANVPLACSSKKAYIGVKGSTIVETLLKIDPTKEYFFENMADVEVQLLATTKEQKQAAGVRGKKQVHYQAPQEMGVGTSQDDDDERDDDEAYQSYQNNP